MKFRSESFQKRNYHIPVWISPGPNNPLYSVEGTKFAIYYTESDAKAGTNAVKTFTIDANGNSATEKIFFGKYYIVETQAGPGYLIPSALSKANGGKQITCDTTKTINLP